MDIVKSENKEMPQQHSIFDDFVELSEKDFYPPEDKRVFRSNVYNIYGGDNYYDYLDDFLDEYGEEIFDGFEK